ncbi:MAG: hypothetical protein EXR86_09840 [Gammaproteobacteria bacterium]|nr:hypothetical protein [Gammaproteobacteria bacterium]
MKSVATIVVMRHAQAIELRPGGIDLARTLTPRGREDARRMGQWLRLQVPNLARVISSPAVRAAQTVETVLMDWPAPASQTVFEPSMYLAELETLVGLLAGSDAAPCLFVGHNPGLEDLLQWLVSEAEGARPDLGLSPAAITVVKFSLDTDRVAQGSARVDCQMTPDRLARD